MNKSIREMLIGTLLGDAHIGRVGSDKAFISCEQSAKKADYLNHLFNQFKDGNIPLMSDTIKLYERTDIRFNTVNSSHYFRTQALAELKPIADMFLDENNKKIVPFDLKSELTHKSLAY
jgi:hypothetical protein